MTEVVTSPIPLSTREARPGSEVGWARAGTADRGLARLGGAVNSLLGIYQGQLICDMMDDAELPLTPSDQCVIDGVHRRWMIKTPSYLDISAKTNRRCTLQARVAKGAGAGLTYGLYVNNVLFGTYAFGAGGLTEQWVTLSSTLELDDTLDYQEIRVEQTGWHGGSALTDYCRGVRLYPNAWAQVEDQADGWRGLRYPVPVSVFGNNDSAASWMLQSMLNNLAWLYERRVPTLYASTAYRNDSAVSTLTDFSKFRADYPVGVTSLKFWAYGSGPLTTSGIAVNGYTTEDGDSFTKFDVAPSWKSLTYDVSPRGAPLLRLASRLCKIYSICAYCQDATYGG